MADPQSFNSGIDWTTKSGLQNPETLNDAVENASFCTASAALDQTTIDDDGSGKARVKDGGITVAKLAADLTGSAPDPVGELTLANMGFDIPGAPGPGGHYVNALYLIDVPASGAYFGYNYVNLEATKAVAAGDVVQVVAAIQVKSVSAGGQWRRAAKFSAVEVNGLSKSENSDQPALFDLIDGGESADIKRCFHLWTFNASGTAKIRVQQSNAVRFGKVGSMALGVLHFPATTS